MHFDDFFLSGKFIAKSKYKSLNKISSQETKKQTKKTHNIPKHKLINNYPLSE